MTDDARKPTGFPTREEREAARLGLSARLRSVGYDGPFDIRSADPLAAMFGATQMYAVCLGCGAMLMLGDPMECPGDLPIERALLLHADHHDRINDPLPTDQEPGT